MEHFAGTPLLVRGPRAAALSGSLALITLRPRMHQGIATALPGAQASRAPPAGSLWSPRLGSSETAQRVDTAAVGAQYILKMGGSTMTACNDQPTSADPTCGWATDQAGARITASQGFCCSCTSSQLLAATVESTSACALGGQRGNGRPIGSTSSQPIEPEPGCTHCGCRARLTAPFLNCLRGDVRPVVAGDSDAWEPGLRPAALLAAAAGVCVLHAPVRGYIPGANLNTCNPP